MKQFLKEDFLLNNDTAVTLYENAVKGLPIFDYHCHLDPQEIWENKNFKNITQVWLAGDHYKWRQMRIHGIDEKFITGDAEDYEKFEAWAETVPYLIGNPLYHWTHMELKTFFGVEKLLSPETAHEIWEECNAKLQTAEFKPRTFIEKSNVKFIGTTDDPASTLEYHQLLKNDASFKTQIAPTFRPDPAVFIERPTFQGWIEKLAEVSGQPVTSVSELVSALQQRVDFFHEMGGRASDNDVQLMAYKETTLQEAEAIFNKKMNGETLSLDELIAYRSFLYKELGKMYAEKQWVLQLHMGATRNNNTRMYNRLGTDIGFDAVGDTPVAEGLSKYLDALDQEGALPRTILYNLNPNDNEVLAAMTGNFYEAGVPGKVQFGSAWWFNDHIDGMKKQMKDLANVGSLSHFVGMLTDSRSLLSYTRHDYFRRILCNLIGEWVEEGQAPNNLAFLQEMVKNIGYNNAERYFLER
jgi:glucuronate isomerase